MCAESLSETPIEQKVSRLDHGAAKDESPPRPFGLSIFAEANHETPSVSYPIGTLSIDSQERVAHIDSNAAAALGFIHPEPLISKLFTDLLNKKYGLEINAASLNGSTFHSIDIDQRNRRVRLIAQPKQRTENTSSVTQYWLFDLTEEQNRLARNSILAQALTLIDDGFVLVNPADYRIIETNHVFDKIFEYLPGALIGKSINSIISDENDKAAITLDECVSALKQTGCWQGELHSVRRDDLEIGCAIRAKKVSHPNFGFVWLLAFRDISEQIISQQILQGQHDLLAHHARLSTFGKLAASITHELTQPLMAIEISNSTALQLAERDPTCSKELRQTLSATNRYVQRANKLIHHLRLFIRRGKTVQEKINVYDVAHSALDLCAPILKENAISFDIVASAELPFAVSDSIQVEQVLVNLIRNSVQAMKSTTNKRRHITITIEPTDDVIKTGVRDTGPGLTNEEIKSIFNPQRSSQSAGLGMGLVLCQTLIQAHNGNLWAEPSNNGEGAAFFFTLPITPSCK